MSCSTWGRGRGGQRASKKSSIGSNHPGIFDIVLEASANVLGPQSYYKMDEMLAKPVILALLTVS